jgi:hypothetical protein
LLTNIEVTDVGIKALANQRHSLPNVSLTNAEVTDEGTTAGAQHWRSLSSALV